MEDYGMNERREIRASDSERAAAVERLRSALDEGRLSLLEYDERLARAYQAVTYGDLADLFMDLPNHGPVAGPVPKRSPAARRSAPEPVHEPEGVVAGLPTALRVLWTIWFVAVSINLVVWGLVSLSNTDLHYFWPMWVAGPAGAALLAVSAGVTAGKRTRQAHRVRRARNRDALH